MEQREDDRLMNKLIERFKIEIGGKMGNERRGEGEEGRKVDRIVEIKKGIERMGLRVIRI